ncbi:Putative white-brown complex homolog protein 30 [Seminavis robusta]|uniref:White-brown complex homolog protein 30 n=1 Tax=Seminavis robusta TaxID=568900 RepID=A0A9N8DT88_9STRA|nr:Putative white-brown complex homolog protein 30 [Seminavis robusta]|eukprot:Sro234_g094530.1 Putative white-brown complex homolog protein 30 (624) ;mRNA; f:65471-68151
MMTSTEQVQVSGTNPKRLGSRAGSNNSGMESSIFKFKNVNFVAGKGDKQKHLLQDVSGTVKFGRVLAVMGPSGAGKTTLISALTLDAHYGTPSGAVTLNGVALTDKLFKRHCYVVKQHDKHWPYLTCRETLQYAAELYQVADRSNIPAVVEETIQKMGLAVCADTRCARLSGGQARRLSIGMALLKQPTVLFLDEPTSGLDAAAADNIMQEIVRVAKDERLIIMCSIHQPSSKVYQGFDQLMILSRGREAYSGDLIDAPPYFESIGAPVPSQMNPAEHYLDLVNSDFSSEEEVVKLLDTWEERAPNQQSSHGPANNDEGQDGVTGGLRRNFFDDLQIMFRRHFKLIIRDPVLYVGRMVMILISNLVFAFVYWNARDYLQSQVPNKHFINIWFVAVASNMGVVAVYALNDEFKSILRETKNGGLNPFAYVVAKSIMVVPVLWVMSIFALAIPGLLVQDQPKDVFLQASLLWTVIMFCFECLAECLSVWVEDQIFGMLQFMNFWFMCFLFSGNFIESTILYYPFELFYHILPFSYYIRSCTYLNLHDATWDQCTGGPAIGQAICVESGDPTEVLDSLSNIYGVVDSEDHVARDMLVIFGIGMIFKILYVVGVWVKTSKVATIKSN